MVARSRQKVKAAWLLDRAVSKAGRGQRWRGPPYVNQSLPKPTFKGRPRPTFLVDSSIIVTQLSYKSLVCCEMDNN